MNNITTEDKIFINYFTRINDLILNTKNNIRKNINYEMVELYYEIGSTINQDNTIVLYVKKIMYLY